MRFHTSILLPLSIIVALLLLTGCQADPALLARLDAAAERSAALQLAPAAVTFPVTILEIKGSTDALEPPEIAPKSLSAGYQYWPPGEFDKENAKKWQVSAYLFSPAAITVAQGDDVTLRIFVVNGDEHGISLLAPDGSTAQESVVMNRGRQYELKFKAEQAGYYTVHCHNHMPTMDIKILVLPTNR